MTPEDLKAWRKQHGFTQVTLAHALGVFPLTISKWETGIRRIPSFLHLALGKLELEGGEKKSRGGTKKKKGKEGKGNA